MKTAPSQLVQDPSRVLRKRIEAGLAQNQLAARIGISAAQLCRIEKGKSGASAPVLSRMANEFGCEVAELLPPEPRAGLAVGSAAA
ncbi:helix-turn-helix transcriptional regulator [Streptomyces sp. NPDC048279]|uniref:helix-turn-helix domain-containing protein n=1 Tax=Streptomyces sp. NPDC048279 TaxID=3154714 RepID=UPI00342D24DA